MLRMLCACLLPVTQVSRADGNAAPRLNFGDDGLFTVLILSDLQDTQYTTKLVVSGETHVLQDYPADLIVLLGDQLEGPSPVLHLGNGAKNSDRAKKPATTSAVKPVRPPTAIPAADSM